VAQEASERRRTHWPWEATAAESADRRAVVRSSRGALTRARIAAPPSSASSRSPDGQVRRLQVHGRGGHRPPPSPNWPAPDSPGQRGIAPTRHFGNGPRPHRAAAGHCGSMALAEADFVPFPTTVLIADDDTSVRRLLRIAFELDGYRTITAADGD